MAPCPERGAKIIGTTGQPDSPIGLFADIVLLAFSREKTINNRSQVLYSPKELLVDMLVFAVIEQPGLPPVF
ncbi:MAG TPA: hypothetical protein GXX57_01460 [Firmicutes bacterium]|nr:hypothetical protein [Bacillota bacterium]